MQGSRQPGQDGDRWKPWRAAACWAAAAILILTGLVALLSPESWANDHVSGTVKMIGGLLLLPPVLRRVRSRVPLTRPIVAPVVFALLLSPFAMLLAAPFTPSDLEQARLRKIAIGRSSDMLRRGNMAAARAAVRRFAGSGKEDPELNALLSRIATAETAAAASASKAQRAVQAGPPSSSPKSIQSGASTYVERVQTYWLPEVRSLPDAPPADEEAFGKLLSRIDGLATDIADGSGLKLNAQEAAVRSRLTTELSAKQARMLPALRQRYAKALDAKLFRDDIRVTLQGRALRLVGAAFVRNANVEDMQTELQPVVRRLRFSRVEYRWNPNLGGSLEYDLQPPADHVVGSWKDATFVKVGR